MQRNLVTDALSQALAEPSRRAILNTLRFGPKSVSELVLSTALKQPNVSNHLAKMREQGVVRAERNGRQVFYSIAMPITDVLLHLHETAGNSLAQLDGDASLSAADSGDQHVRRATQPSDCEVLLPQDAHPMSNGQTADPMAEWRDAFFRSILSGEEERAVSLVNAMLARRIRMETIYTEVFARALNQVGDIYEQGLTDEAHEHLASAITERLMAKVAQFYAPVVKNTYRAVLGCVAGNWHMLGLRMLADGLKQMGWETLFLGANVPTTSFLAMAVSMKPDLVVVSCVMEDQVPEARQLISELLAARPKQDNAPFQIALGGFYVNTNPELLQELHVDFGAEGLPEFLQTVQERFSESRLPKSAPPSS